jgi:uncharacterized LabA/DUF88 family protein
MSISGSSAGPKPLERVMVFVDGGYLRELSKNLEKTDTINYSHLSWVFIRMFNTITANPFRANLIRIYFYDAIVNKSHPDYEKDREYFDHIDEQYAYTVRLGEVVESPKERKQKGVDVLMAIDAITKAYRDQYDTGMFMVGDADFIPLIEAVKDAGKKTIGVCYEPSTSRKLLRAFDLRIYFDEKAVKGWLNKKEGS